MFSIFKTAKWNDDPDQRLLAQMILHAALYEYTGGKSGQPLSPTKIFQHCSACGWLPRESGNRIVHAVSMIKVEAPPNVYRVAKQMAHDLYVNGQSSSSAGGSVTFSQNVPQADKPDTPALKPHARASKALQFKVNELIVYPTHGVGRIVQIEEQEIGGVKLELYVIDFEKEKVRLKVPTSKSEQKGMRKLADKLLIDHAMKVLESRAASHEYEAKINSGDLIAVAEVVRDLYRSQHQPEQSYFERQLFEQALDRMAREIAAVKKIDDDMAIKEIETFLAKLADKRRIGE